MSYAQYLRELLRPLGVYDLEAPFSGGELDTEGQALDGAEGTLEEVGREVDLTSARDWGLEWLAGLFVRRPAAGTPEELGQALAALLPGALLCLDGVRLENGDYLDIGAPVAGGAVLPVVIKTLVFNKS